MPAFFLAVMLRDGLGESFVLVQSRTAGDRCQVPASVARPVVEVRGFCGHWGNEPRTSKTSPRSRIRRVGKGAFTPEVTGVTHDMYENTKTYSQLEGFL
jgi:hypothetical protein